MRGAVKKWLDMIGSVNHKKAPAIIAYPDGLDASGQFPEVTLALYDDPEYKDLEPR